MAPAKSSTIPFIQQHIYSHARPTINSMLSYIKEPIRHLEKKIAHSHIERCTDQFTSKNIVCIFPVQILPIFLVFFLFFCSRRIIVSAFQSFIFQRFWLSCDFFYFVAVVVHPKSRHIRELMPALICSRRKKTNLSKSKSIYKRLSRSPSISIFLFLFCFTRQIFYMIFIFFSAFIRIETSF